MSSLRLISGIFLTNDGGYACRFTLQWLNNGQPEPRTSYPNWDDWTWSDRLLLGQRQYLALSQFALPNAPLADGTEVWLYLWVEAGHDIDSPLRFIYNHDAFEWAAFSCAGTATSPTLALTGFGPPIHVGSSA